MMSRNWLIGSTKGMRSTICKSYVSLTEAREVLTTGGRSTMTMVSCAVCTSMMTFISVAELMPTRMFSWTTGFMPGVVAVTL
jgi:hypothetical protein